LAKSRETRRHATRNVNFKREMGVYVDPKDANGGGRCNIGSPYSDQVTWKGLFSLFGRTPHYFGLVGVKEKAVLLEPGNDVI